MIASSEPAAYVGDLARGATSGCRTPRHAPRRAPRPACGRCTSISAAETDFQGLLGFLDSLERGDKLIRVERLDVSRGLKAAGNEKAETLTIAATIAGYAMGNDAPPPPPAPVAAPARGPAMTWRDWTAGTGMRVALRRSGRRGDALCGPPSAALRPDVVARRHPPVITPGALDMPAPPPPVDSRRRWPPTSSRRHVRRRGALPEPGEVPARPARPPAPPQPIVLGTALAADGSSFATCQYQSARLLMVRVGDQVGDYVVKTIERGRVVFTTPAGNPRNSRAPTRELIAMPRFRRLALFARSPPCRWRRSAADPAGRAGQAGQRWPTQGGATKQGRRTRSISRIRTSRWCCRRWPRPAT